MLDTNEAFFYILCTTHNVFAGGMWEAGHHLLTFVLKE